MSGQRHWQKFLRRSQGSSSEEDEGLGDNGNSATPRNGEPTPGVTHAGFGERAGNGAAGGAVGLLRQQLQPESLFHQGTVQQPAPTIRETPYYVRAYFRVAINTAFGQKVRVVGGFPNLGSWDPSKGLVLTTTDEVFPVWFSREPVHLPLMVPAYYQYVVVNDQTNEIIEWDSHGENRKIIPTGYEMTVEDDGGLYRTLTRGPTTKPAGLGGLGSRATMRSPLFRVRGTGHVDEAPVPKQADLGPLSGTLLSTCLKEQEAESPVCGTAGAAESNQAAAAGSTPSSATGNESTLPGNHAGSASFSRAERSCSFQQGHMSTTSDAELTETHTDVPNGLSGEALQAIRELKESEGQVQLFPNDTLIIVSFDLPVRVVRHRDLEPNKAPDPANYEVVQANALLMPGLHRIRRSFGCSIKFVGYCGINSENEAEQDLIRGLLETHDCYPVFPKPADFELFVTFCHKFLSPLFHSVIDVAQHIQEPFSIDSWLAYQAINQQWANKALAHYNGEGDIIWVHDFHLLLVPQYVARRYKRCNTGLFLHVPFPSSELFRCLPVRGELLRGMLCADLVGFNFFEYARHFFVVNKRLLGLEHQFTLGGFLGIEYCGRNVMIKISHVNVEYHELQRSLEPRDDIRARAKAIRQEYSGRFIFGAVDRCDQLAGLILKLKGFRHLLANFPYCRNKVVLVQYAYPGRMNTKDAEKMEASLTMLANRINFEFGPHAHVELRLQAVQPEEKYAILQACDCLLDTSIRDGLNLIAFEYMAVRHDHPSHMILSEFTGCARTLATAVRINPWHLEGMASAMDRVMSTQTDILQERWARDAAYLSQHSLKKWAVEFLADLQRARKTGSKVYLQCGFASTFRVLTMDESFQPLDVRQVIQAYRSSNRRMLFFDHEGTLAPDRRHLAVLPGHKALSATGTPPSQAVKAALATLSQDSNNIVVIFSGRDRKCLEEWFGDLPEVGLCAEHGFYTKIPAITGHQWHCMSDTVDFTWKQIAVELMLQYTKRTQASFIENKGSALVFQYRDADPDFGSWQAKELATYLEEFLFGQPVTIMTGKGYVEAKLRGVSKGVAVEYVLNSIASIFGTPDFVLCLGDDRTDEDMFAAVNKLDSGEASDREPISSTSSRSLISSAGGGLLASTASGRGAGIRKSRNMRLVTCTVGKKPSNAHYYVNDTDEVSDLLNAMKAQCTQVDGAADTGAIVVGSLLRHQHPSVGTDLLGSETPGVVDADGDVDGGTGTGWWPGSEALYPHGLSPGGGVESPNLLSGGLDSTAVQLSDEKSRILDQFCVD